MSLYVFLFFGQALYYAGKDNAQSISAGVGMSDASVAYRSRSAHFGGYLFGIFGSLHRRFGRFLHGGKQFFSRFRACGKAVGSRNQSVNQRFVAYLRASAKRSFSRLLNTRNGGLKHFGKLFNSYFLNVA